jgi:hypothetical protein
MKRILNICGTWATLLIVIALVFSTEPLADIIFNVL